jgi:hypothetical protein
LFPVTSLLNEDFVDPTVIERYQLRFSTLPGGSMSLPNGPGQANLTYAFKRRPMKGIIFLCIAVATAACLFASTIPASGQGGGEAAPIYGIKIPPGYRDWKFVSVAHEEGNLHSIGAVLANDVAFQAFRDGKLPYPDGSIIAALHYKHSPSAENDKVFGDPQSFVAGAPTNVQFMVKDSVKYASTGGWGYAHFDADGKSGTEAALKSCAPCHAKASRDAVFTKYAP